MMNRRFYASPIPWGYGWLLYWRGPIALISSKFSGNIVIVPHCVFSRSVCHACIHSVFCACYLLLIVCTIWFFFFMNAFEFPKSSSNTSVTFSGYAICFVWVVVIWLQLIILKYQLENEDTFLYLAGNWFAFSFLSSNIFSTYRRKQ